MKKIGNSLRRFKSWVFGGESIDDDSYWDYADYDSDARSIVVIALMLLIIIPIIFIIIWIDGQFK